ncbi:MAG: dTDP-4-dehydrorhamnose 3,5-epimerase [Gemmatimonadota bacterium]
MKVRALDELPGVLIVEPDVHEDDRGFFLETWRHELYAEHGMDTLFVQDNRSRSEPGVLRGLHFQHPTPQAKLVYVTLGAILDVIVDVRTGSPDFGRWAGVPLSAADHRQVFVPEGFAHGFAVTDGPAEIIYKCGAPYRSEHERVLAWDDPDLAITWPIQRPALSDRDAAGMSLDALRSAGVLPTGRR